MVVDTSVWIEYFRGNNPSTTKRLNELLEINSVVALAPIFGELLQGARNEEEEKIILEFWHNLPKIDERELLIRSGRISWRNKFFGKGIGLIDTYIIVAARVSQSNIWTLDKKLHDAFQRV